MIDSFFHSKNNCGGMILLDITANILFVSTFGISKGTLRIGTGNISIKDSKSIKPQFCCLECKSDKIRLADISARCYYCGDEFSLNNLFRVSDSGGPYCDECSRNKFPGVSRGKLITIFSKLSLSKI